jgi:hypothetical protein
MVRIHLPPAESPLRTRLRPGRVEPELGPATVPRTAYPTVTSDSPAAAGLSGVVSDFDTEPRLFEFVTREAELTSAPSRSAPAKRPHIGSVFYLLQVGLVAAAIIGVFFGVAFSLLTLPKDHTVVSAGPVSPGAEEAVSSQPGSSSMNDGGFFEPSPLRIIPYLNVSSPGIFVVSAAVTVGECADLRLLDPRECVRVIEANRDLIAGVKVLVGRNAGGTAGVAPLDIALEVAEDGSGTPPLRPPVRARTREG